MIVKMQRQRSTLTQRSLLADLLTVVREIQQQLLVLQIMVPIWIPDVDAHSRHVLEAELLVVVVH